MSDDTRDTHPSPPPGEMLDALAEDIDAVVEAIRLATHSLENSASAIRREAAEARH